MTHPPQPTRPTTTTGGWRNWNRLVDLAILDPADLRGRGMLIDSLAALLAEITPVHREVVASQMAHGRAPGRVHTWRLPSVLPDDPDAARKWAATVLLDCVDGIADRHARRYSDAERRSWQDHARRYTGGAEALPVSLFPTGKDL